jgi:type I restriction enzyme S subunit
MNAKTQERKFKQTEIGEIPADWEVKRFGNIVEYSLGKTPPRRESKYWAKDNKGFFWVSISDMKPFSIINFTSEKITEESLKIMPSNIVHKGTLLMSFKLTIGRTSILGVNAFHNEAIISIKPKNDVIRDFLLYYLPTINYSQYYDKVVKGQTLNKSKLNNLPVILPPKPEQEKIVEVLTKIQNAVENQEKLVKNLKELKSATMAKLFREGLNGEPLKQTEIGEIPKSWEIKAFDKAVDNSLNESKDSELKSSYKTNGLYPIIDQGNDFIAGYTDDESKVYKKCIPIIIFGDHTRVFKYVDFPFVTGADGTKLIKANEEIYNPKFLYYAFKSINIPNRGYNRHFKILKDYFLPCPPKMEQQKIVEILDTISKKEEFAERKLKELNSLFSSTLNQLMTGKIRVN